MARGPAPDITCDITCGPCRPGDSPTLRPEEKERGWFTLWPTLEHWNGIGGSCLSGVCFPCWATHGGPRRPNTRNNKSYPGFAQPGGLAGSCHKKILSHERPHAQRGGLHPPPLGPPPPLLFPVTTCKLKTNLPLPPHPGFCSTPPPPPCPAPHPGPSCRRPQQSVIPLALLSALGPSGQIKPLSHTPRKAQGQMGQDKWCQIIDPLLAGTWEGPRPQHRIWLWEEKRGPSEGAATWKRDDTSRPPLGPSPRRGPLFSFWITQPPHPLFPEIILPGFLIICAHLPYQLGAPVAGRVQLTSMPQCPPKDLWVLNKCLRQRFMAQ